MGVQIDTIALGVGNSYVIRDKGAKLAMHEKEKECLEKGLMPLPTGFNLWGTVMLEKGAKKVYPAHGNPFPVDVIEKALAKD